MAKRGDEYSLTSTFFTTWVLKADRKGKLWISAGIVNTAARRDTLSSWNPDVHILPILPRIHCLDWRCSSITARSADGSLTETVRQDSLLMHAGSCPKTMPRLQSRRLPRMAQTALRPTRSCTTRG